MGTKELKKILTNYLKHLPEALLANIKYGFPAQNIKIIGITGTDGKTTTVNMVYQILMASGKKASMISTINAVIGGKVYDTGFHVTTPQASEIQKYLKTAKDAGDEYMVLETSSHALAQFRVWGISYEVGIITNITHEHLDYHGTFERYVLDKAKLVQNSNVSVLNLDDPSFNTLKTHAGKRVVTFGLSPKADFNPKSFPLKLQIPGDYNILNALGAAAICSVLGIDKNIIKKSLESFKGILGRMEEIKNNKGIKVVVDFAHTPNGLEQAIKTLKSQTSGKVIALFGCPAERDKEKRPMMGEIASKYADIIILSDDEPRFEGSMNIINQIAKGVDTKKFVEGKNFFKEPNRMKAIEIAVSLASRGDSIGLFGKGHERSINYEGKETPWSDQEAAQKALK